MTLCVCILYFVIRRLNDRRKTKQQKKKTETHNFTEISDHKSQVVICLSVENDVKSQNLGKVISILNKWHALIKADKTKSSVVCCLIGYSSHPSTRWVALDTEIWRTSCSSLKRPVMTNSSFLSWMGHFQSRLMSVYPSLFVDADMKGTWLIQWYAASVSDFDTHLYVLAKSTDTANPLKATV